MDLEPGIPWSCCGELNLLTLFCVDLGVAEAFSKQHLGQFERQDGKGNWGLLVLGACGMTDAVVFLKHREGKMRLQSCSGNPVGKLSVPWPRFRLGNGVTLAQVLPSNHRTPRLAFWRIQKCVLSTDGQAGCPTSAAPRFLTTGSGSSFVPCHVLGRMAGHSPRVYNIYNGTGRSGLSRVQNRPAE